MGPAILLCPSSAVQLLGQVSPSKTTRQKLFLSPNESARPLLDVHWKGDFARRSIHSFSSNVALQRRKNDVPFAWRVASAAVGEEVSLEEPITENGVVLDSAALVEQEPAVAVDGEETPEPKTQTRRSVQRRNIVVSKEELVPGATFTGKVTSIQSFGAFIDMGAFTNGLIHISRLSKAFVKRVEDVVQIGQEVTVEILDVDLQANRISLMLKGDEQQEEEQVSKAKAPRRSDTGRRDAVLPALKNLKKGDTLSGVVKNIIRSGVFVTLPDGIDGFLPATEAGLRGTATLDTHFQLGQELTVRVLRIEKGRVRLTTKQELDLTKFNETLNKDSAGAATSPFEIAFLKNELIANYIAEKKKIQDAAEGKAVEAEAEAAVEQVVEEQSSETVLKKQQIEVPSDVEAVHSVGGAILEQATEETVQGDAVPEDSLKEAVQEIEEQPQSIAGEELSTEEVAAAVDEAAADEVLVSAAAEEVVVPVKEEERPAVKEAAAEEVVASADDVVAPVEEEVAATEEVPASEAEEAVASAEDVVVEEEVAAVEEAAAEEVAASVAEDVAVEEAARVEEVVDSVVEEKVAAVVEAAEEVAAVVKEAAVEEVAAPVVEEAAEELVAPVEDSVAPVEEEVASVEEPAAEEVVASVAEEAAQELVASVEESAAEEMVASVEEEAAEEVVASLEEAAAVVETAAEEVAAAAEEARAKEEVVASVVEEAAEGVVASVEVPVEEKVAPVEEAAAEEVLSITEEATEEMVASVEEVATVVEAAVEEVVVSVEEEVAAVEEAAAEEVVASMEGPTPAEEAIASIEDTVAPVKEAPAEEAVASEDMVASGKEASAESVVAVAE